MLAPPLVCFKMTSAWDVPQPYVRCILEELYKIFVAYWVIPRCMLTVLYKTKFAIRVENSFMIFTIKIEVNKFFIQ